MDALPLEILDGIFKGLWQCESPVTARLEIFTQPARQAILNSRLVQRRWNESSVLESIFTYVLEETPFVWHNHRILKLEEIGFSELGNKMRTLSLCGMDMGLVTQSASARWGMDRSAQETDMPIVEYLVHLLQRLTWVDHLIFYPIHPKCLDGTWPDWKVSRSDQQGDQYGWEHFGYPALANGEQSWYGVQKEAAWIFDRIMHGIADSILGDHLQSIKMPLMGNRTSYCGVPTYLENMFLPQLTYVAVSVSHVPNGFFFMPYLEMMTSLEYLEVAFSTCPELMGGHDLSGGYIKTFLPRAPPYCLTSSTHSLPTE